jgi:hypothetical protein
VVTPLRRSIRESNLNANPARAQRHVRRQIIADDFFQ